MSIILGDVSITLLVVIDRLPLDSWFRWQHYEEWSIWRSIIQSNLWSLRITTRSWIWFDEWILSTAVNMSILLWIGLMNRVNKFNVAVFQPMIKYLESHYNSEFYGYMNGDIVMSSQIYDVLTTLLEMRDNHTITDQVFCFQNILVIDLCDRKENQYAFQWVLSHSKIFKVLWFGHSLCLPFTPGRFCSSNGILTIITNKGDHVE